MRISRMVRSSIVNIHDESWSVVGSVFAFRLLFRLCPPPEISAVPADASTSSGPSSSFRLRSIGIGFNFCFCWVGCGTVDFFFLTLRGFGSFGPLFLILWGSTCWTEAESLANSDSGGRSAASSACNEAIKSRNCQSDTFGSLVPWLSMSHRWVVRESSPND